jgi:hypothetical protein
MLKEWFQDVGFYKTILFNPSGRLAEAESIADVANVVKQTVDIAEGRALVHRDSEYGHEVHWALGRGDPFFFSIKPADWNSLAWHAGVSMKNLASVRQKWIMESTFPEYSSVKRIVDLFAPRVDRGAVTTYIEVLGYERPEIVPLKFLHLAKTVAPKERREHPEADFMYVFMCMLGNEVGVSGIPATEDLLTMQDRIEE